MRTFVASNLKEVEAVNKQDTVSSADIEVILQFPALMGCIKITGVCVLLISMKFETLQFAFMRLTEGNLLMNGQRGTKLDESGHGKKDCVVESKLLFTYLRSISA